MADGVPVSVPVVDISGWGNGSVAQRSAIAQAVDAGCRSVGFLQIVGHSISADVIDDLLAAADTLFASPLAEKLTWVPSSPEVNRGYAAKGTEGLSYSIGASSPPDLFEAFNIGLDVVPNTPEYQARIHDLFAPNIWPSGDRLSNARAQIVSYFDAAVLQAHTLTQIFAVALGLDEDFFTQRTTHFNRHAAN